MGGKNACGVAVAAFLVAAACGAGLAMAGPGQAATRDGCTGQDCRVRTVTPACRAFASFEACSSARVGRVACDGDAGVLRMCARDGGWDAIGSSGGGSSSEWLRGGGVLKADAGLSLWLPNSPSTPALAIATNGTPAAALSVQGNFLSLRGAGSHVDVTDLSGTASEAWALRFRASAGVGAAAYQVASTGARYYFDSSSSALYAFGRTSPDNSVVVAGGLQIGATNSARVSSWPRTTLVHDGGTVAAHSIYSQTVTLTGATAGAECAVGYGFQPAGMVITCQCGDMNTVTAHFVNVTAGGLTPGTGPVALRCFNP